MVQEEKASQGIKAPGRWLAQEEEEFSRRRQNAEGNTLETYLSRWRDWEQDEAKARELAEAAYNADQQVLQKLAKARQSHEYKLGVIAFGAYLEASVGLTVDRVPVIATLQLLAKAHTPQFDPGIKTVAKLQDHLWQMEGIYDAQTPVLANLIQRLSEDTDLLSELLDQSDIIAGPPAGNGAPSDQPAQALDDQHLLASVDETVTNIAQSTKTPLPDICKKGLATVAKWVALSHLAGNSQFRQKEKLIEDLKVQAQAWKEEPVGMKLGILKLMDETTIGGFLGKFAPPAPQPR